MQFIQGAGDSGVDAAGLFKSSVTRSANESISPLLKKYNNYFSLVK